MSDLLAPRAATVPGQIPFSCDSKAAAVAILKASITLDVNTRMSLTPYLVDGIIRAEAKRIGRWEWLGEQILPTDIPADIPLLGRLGPLARKLYKRTGGQGPGQLYLDAYQHVELKLRPELNQFYVHMGVNCRAGLHRGCGEVPLIRKGYPGDVIDPITADFFIAAYLALRVQKAMKPGRSADDQLQFGIGLYFGAFDTIARAQAAISPHDHGESVLRYPPVRDYLLRSSDEKDRDVAAYIQEVFGRR